MRLPSVLTFLLVFCMISLQAQQPRYKSAGNISIGINEPALFDQFMYVVPGVGSSSRDRLLQQSLKPYMMPVRQTGVRGKDLAYAAAYCLEYYVNLGRNYKINLSPDYISLSLSGVGKPFNAKEAIGFLAEQGTVNAAIVPYDAQELTGAVFATQKYDIVNYLHIFTNLTRDRQRVFETKKALLKGNPILVEMYTDDQIRAQVGTRQLNGIKPGNTASPFIVVGYDEDQEAFEMMSCWGSNWGDDGYIWVKYDDYGKLARDGFVMIPKETYQ